MFQKSLCFTLQGLAILMLPAAVWAIPRQEVMTRAKAVVNHPWHCSAENLVASCSSNYSSDYIVGDHMSLPYDWGGWMSLHTFDKEISQGNAAGSHSRHGVLSCTSGLDCSGFVNQCWRSGRYTTSRIPDITTEIDKYSMLRGDAFNDAGSHVILFSHYKSDGAPYMYEASGKNVHPTFTKTWSYVDGYKSVRYDNIEDGPAGDPTGTVDQPIAINSFPFSARGNTSGAPSRAFDYCAASPNTNETGPEQIYRVQLSQPGTLVASVQEDTGVDVDVHIYANLAERDCLARHDHSTSAEVNCGVYYVIVDTYVSNGTEKAGGYELTVDFAPRSASCNRTPEYEFEGSLGAACDSASHWCNLAFYATDCVSGYCTRSCEGSEACSDMPGACCRASGSKRYCLYASDCPAPPQDASLPADSELADAGGNDASEPPDASLDAEIIVPADSEVEDSGNFDAGDAQSGFDAGNDASGDAIVSIDSGNDASGDANVSIDSGNGPSGDANVSIDSGKDPSENDGGQSPGENRDGGHSTTDFDGNGHQVEPIDTNNGENQGGSENSEDEITDGGLIRIKPTANAAGCSVGGQPATPWIFGFLLIPACLRKKRR